MTETYTNIPLAMPREVACNERQAGGGGGRREGGGGGKELRRGGGGARKEGERARIEGGGEWEAGTEKRTGLALTLGGGRRRRAEGGGLRRKKKRYGGGVLPSLEPSTPNTS